MSQQLTSLWPKDLGGSKLTPIKILEEQARALEELTARRLRGSVRRELNQATVHLSFEIIADRLKYTHQLLEVTHADQMIYPATITFGEEIFVSSDGGLTFQVECPDDNDFIDNLERALHSSRTREVVTSLLARIDEMVVEENAASSAV